MENTGIVVIGDTAYQGFDGGTFGVPESAGEFWCRRITVRRESDGRVACATGPRESAFTYAVANLDNCEAAIYHGGIEGAADAHRTCAVERCFCDCHKAVTA